MAFSAKVRARIIRRDDGLCVLCGAPATNIHHRMPRGAGGSKHRPWVDREACGLSLCGSGTTGCHGWIEGHRAEALKMGWLVPRNGLLRPSEVPYWSPADGRWWLLDDEGNRVEWVDEPAS